MSGSAVRVAVEGELVLTGWKLRDMSECHSCVCGWADTELGSYETDGILDSLIKCNDILGTIATEIDTKRCDIRGLSGNYVLTTKE